MKHLHSATDLWCFAENFICIYSVAFGNVLLSNGDLHSEGNSTLPAVNDFPKS